MAVTAALASSGFEQVVHVERLRLCGEPLGAVGGTLLAAFVERQLQRFDEPHDLLPRGYVREARPHAKCIFVEGVERGEPAWEELAVYHALGQTFDTAEAEAGREFAQALADQTLVAGAECGEPVAYDHPIYPRAVE